MMQFFKNKFSKCMDTLKEKKLYEAVSYIFFGGLTTLVNWLVYFLMIQLLQPENSQNQALLFNITQISAFALSVLFAFLTNKKYVFFSKTKKGAVLRELFSFFSFRIGSYLVFDLLLYNVFVFSFHINHWLTKIFMNVLVVIANYFASKFVVFRNKK